MAEAIGLVASCLSILKTIETLNTIIASNIRTKAAAKKELVPILGKLEAYKGLIEGIKLEAELDEADHGRLSALLHVDGPLHSCELALKTISNRLEHLPRHIVPGKLLDGTTIKALKTLDESRQILNLALDADQRSVSTDPPHLFIKFSRLVTRGVGIAKKLRVEQSRNQSSNTSSISQRTSVIFVMRLGNISRHSGIISSSYAREITFRRIASSLRRRLKEIAFVSGLHPVTHPEFMSKAYKYHIQALENGSWITSFVGG